MSAFDLPPLDRERAILALCILDPVARSVYRCGRDLDLPWRETLEVLVLELAAAKDAIVKQAVEDAARRAPFPLEKPPL